MCGAKCIPLSINNKIRVETGRKDSGMARLGLKTGAVIHEVGKKNYRLNRGFVWS